MAVVLSGPASHGGALRRSPALWPGGWDCGWWGRPRGAQLPPDLVQGFFALPQGNQGGPLLFSGPPQLQRPLVPLGGLPRCPSGSYPSQLGVGAGPLPHPCSLGPVSLSPGGAGSWGGRPFSQAAFRLHSSLSLASQQQPSRGGPPAVSCCSHLSCLPLQVARSASPREGSPLSRGHLSPLRAWLARPPSSCNLSRDRSAHAPSGPRLAPSSGPSPLVAPGRPLASRWGLLPAAEGLGLEFLLASRPPYLRGVPPPPSGVTPPFPLPVAGDRRFPLAGKSRSLIH